MIYTIKDYYVADNQIISDDDILDAMKIANETNEIVRIRWSGPGYQYYPSETYAYSLMVRPNSDFTELKKLIPNIYGI